MTFALPYDWITIPEEYKQPEPCVKLSQQEIAFITTTYKCERAQNTLEMIIDERETVVA